MSRGMTVWPNPYSIDTRHCRDAEKRATAPLDPANHCGIAIGDELDINMSIAVGGW